MVGRTLIGVSALALMVGGYFLAGTLAPAGEAPETIWIHVSRGGPEFRDPRTAPGGAKVDSLCLYASMDRTTIWYRVDGTRLSGLLRRWGLLRQDRREHVFYRLFRPVQVPVLGLWGEFRLEARHRR
jgi:hypothetical protein